VRCWLYSGGLEFLFNQQRLPKESPLPIEPDVTVQEAVAKAVLRTMAYRDARHRSGRRITRMAA
jgi:hypothetical protein